MSKTIGIQAQTVIINRNDIKETTTIATGYKMRFINIPTIKNLKT